MSGAIEELKELCQICYEQKFKYKCPKCGTKTCSLECVKKHKTQSQCDGVIDNAKFVKRSEFKENENLVHRDYNFLMKMNRTIEVSKNDVRSKNKKILSNYHNNNKRFQRDSASNNYESIVKRGVKIRKLPRGMQRNNMNKSGWDQKKDTYVWTIEWILIDNETGSELAKHFSFRVPEGTKLEEAIHQTIKEKVGEVPMFCFLKKIDTPASNPQFIPLDNEHLLADVLRDQTVIEFPTILVAKEKEVKGYTVYESEESESESESSSSEESSSEESSSEEDSEPEEVSSKQQGNTENSEQNTEEVKAKEDETKDPIPESTDELEIKETTAF